MKLEYGEVIQAAIKVKEFTQAQKSMWAIMKQQEKSHNVLTILESTLENSVVRREIENGMPLEFVTSCIKRIFHKSVDKKNNMLNLMDSFAKHRYVLKDGLLYPKREKE